MTQPILLLNCGSSSIKYQMIDAESEDVMASGIVQKIGDAGVGTLDHKVNGEEHHVDQLFPDHTQALQAVVEMFHRFGPRIEDAIAVGHRTVHGGEEFSAPVKIDDRVVEEMRTLIPLAPLHNPACIAGIEAARAVLPNVPHVAVFDTAFFSDLPAEAYTYAIDAETARELSIRRYGFHGTSHDFVSHAAAVLLDKPYGELKQIVCHIGNGASVSAISNGKPIETSMGLTPLQGLVMGTRSGDVDPGLVAYLATQKDWTAAEVDTFLNKRSGVFGLAGVTDMRDLESKVNAGDEAGKLALDVYTHRLAFYVGGYITLLGGCDAITFTAGVGENSDLVRREVCNRLAGLGVKLDDEANRTRSKEPRVISTPDSAIKVLVIPTNEELAMARQTLAVVGQ